MVRAWKVRREEFCPMRARATRAIAELNPLRRMRGQLGVRLETELQRRWPPRVKRKGIARAGWVTCPPPPFQPPNDERSTYVSRSLCSREGDRLGSGQPLAQEVGDPRRKPPLARLRVCGAKPGERIASPPAGQGRNTRSLTRLNAAVCPCEPSARHSEVRESLAGSSLGADNGPF